MLRIPSPFRLRLLISTFVCIAVILYIASQWQYSPRINNAQFGGDATKTDEGPKAHGEFWQAFQPILADHAPDVEPPKRTQGAESTWFNPKENSERPDKMAMSAKDVEKMKRLHASFLKTIEQQGHRPYYVPGTRGLVSTAGGRYLPVLTISLRMLRNRGSTLPMEVFLASDEEYEPYICEEVLPALNAKCVVLDNILKFAPETAEIAQYQYKPFAMLFSSFEEMLFLDADAFPLHDPTVLFLSDPFASLKMVTWPDFWGSSASPLYYKIASQPEPRMTVRASTESGELLISKKTHQKTIMLATYYNYYGPSLYYPLFSQGAAGEGDKETFIAAATAVGDPFYQVSERIRAIGHRIKGGMAGSAMVQYDPVDDYELTQQGLWRVKDPSVAKSPRPFFIHANVPKFNPATIFDDHPIDPVRDEEGNFVRPWTIPEDSIEEFGEDIEKQFWTEIKWVACELEDKFASWKDKKGICDGIKKYWEIIFENGKKT